MVSARRDKELRVDPGIKVRHRVEGHAATTATSATEEDVAGTFADVSLAGKGVGGHRDVEPA